jgi:hypothetical protein
MYKRWPLQAVLIMEGPENKNTIILKQHLYLLKVYLHSLNYVALKRCLENGANSNAKDIFGNTGLHIACILHNQSMWRLFILHGANPLEKDFLDGTALHFAALHITELDFFKEVFNAVFEKEYIHNSMLQNPNPFTYLLSIHAQDKYGFPETKKTLLQIGRENENGDISRMFRNWEHPLAFL